MAMLGAPDFRITKPMVPTAAGNASILVGNSSDKNGRDYARVSPDPRNGSVRWRHARANVHPPLSAELH